MNIVSKLSDNCFIFPSISSMFERIFDLFVQFLKNSISSLVLIIICMYSSHKLFFFVFSELPIKCKIIIKYNHTGFIYVKCVTLIHVKYFWSR